jgi:thioredoxin-dependent peroxiredoxin
MRRSVIKGLFTMALVTLSSIAAHALEVGEKAPLFEARSTRGVIRLADYLGKKDVVLAFYIADFTPV